MKREQKEKSDFVPFMFWFLMPVWLLALVILVMAALEFFGIADF
jgi:hypothetical protein